jgi:hypothetical protein
MIARVYIRPVSIGLGLTLHAAQTYRRPDAIEFTTTARYCRIDRRPHRSNQPPLKTQSLQILALADGQTPLIVQRPHKPKAAPLRQG